MLRDRFSLAAISALVFAGAATMSCQHVSPPPEKGESSFAFIAAPRDPPPPQKKGNISAAPSPNRDIVAPPQAIGELARPVYPPLALAKHAGAAMVGLRLTIGVEGSVTSMAPSLAVISSPGPFAAEFREAVENAVRQWRFRPAEIRHLQMVADPGGPYLSLVSRESIESTVDVQFRFSASGEVVAGGSK